MINTQGQEVKLKKRLIIINNACFLEKMKDQYESIVFAPIFKSLPQKKYYESRFNNLTTKYPYVKWSENLEPQGSDDILAWNSYLEKKAFKNAILPYQNRLFDTIPFEVGDTFTPFRKKIEGLLPDYYTDAVKPFDEEILKELDYYFDDKKLPSHYFETRNGFLGRDFSTKFSSHLSSGFLDVKFLYNKVKDYENLNGSNKSTYWIIFELLWREFFYWLYQKHTTHFFSKNGIQGPHDFSDFSSSFIDIDKLKQMGPPFFRACVNELSKTGYLSNRARQMFASIWINDLELDWRIGAKLFETYLTDYDVYSNYGNWMYLAGVGSDPRGKRYFNLEKQLKNYDPEGAYIKFWGF